MLDLVHAAAEAASVDRALDSLPIALPPGEERALSPMHAEDALLAELERWSGRQGLESLARELLRELVISAFEHIEEPAGPWQGLCLSSWLRAEALPLARHMGLGTQGLVASVRLLFAFLSDSGRLSLHGLRQLSAELNAETCPPRAVHPGKPLARVA
ncbi:MAG: hypothetical protein OEZ06_01665 [Myxococcales bacterium]|nr:hypothetical protein [Myxococcales bacterium]